MKPASSDVERIVRLLRQRIHDSGWTLRSVARELGWHEDYLSQLFRGSPQLKLEQLFAVLRVIRLAPAEFFEEVAAAFSEVRTSRPGSHGDTTVPSPRLDLDELQELIDSRIRQVLDVLEEDEDHRAAGAGSGPPRRGS